MYVRKYFTYVKHEEHFINIREVKINVRELENFSGNIRETEVTSVKLAQTVTEALNALQRLYYLLQRSY